MDDLEFVSSCISGDNAKWEEFVEKYSSLIYNYIHSVLKNGSEDPVSQENVNDIFQEIFISLTKDNFRKLKSYKAKNNCSFASWLRQVTVNHTIGHARKIRYQLSLEEKNDEGIAIKEFIKDEAQSAIGRMSIEETLAQLHKCIDSLNIDDRFFLELYLNQQVSLDVMKSIFKLSRGAVDMRKSRIISRLRDCFRINGFLI